MSQAEIWDDSSLVNSWNEALEEYKHYHSIHARGEKVEDVLREKERIDAGGQANYEERPNVSQAPGDHQAQKILQEETAHQTQIPLLNAGDGPVASKAVQEKQAPTVPALPQHLIGQVHDESLKNLLMAWYYAGYYQGRYEEKAEAVSNARTNF